MMNGLALLLALAAPAIDQGWRTTATGDLECIIQVEPVLIQALMDGELSEILTGALPNDGGRTTRFRIRVGDRPLPPDTTPEPPRIAAVQAQATELTLTPTSVRRPPGGERVPLAPGAFETQDRRPTTPIYSPPASQPAGNMGNAPAPTSSRPPPLLPTYGNRNIEERRPSGATVAGSDVVDKRPPPLANPLPRDPEVAPTRPQLPYRSTTNTNTNTDNANANTGPYRYSTTPARETNPPYRGYQSDVSRDGGPVRYAEDDPLYRRRAGESIDPRPFRDREDYPYRTADGARQPSSRGGGLTSVRDERQPPFRTREYERQPEYDREYREANNVKSEQPRSPEVRRVTERPPVIEAKASGDPAKGEQGKKDVEEDRPWGTLFACSAALLFSLAGNVFLGWVAYGSYQRFWDLSDQLRRRANRDDGDFDDSPAERRRSRRVLP